jgi:hypothetical protein
VSKTTLIEEEDFDIYFLELNSYQEALVEYDSGSGIVTLKTDRNSPDFKDGVDEFESLAFDTAFLDFEYGLDYFLKVGKVQLVFSKENSRIRSAMLSARKEIAKLGMEQDLIFTKTKEIAESKFGKLSRSREDKLFDYLFNSFDSNPFS